MHRIRFILSVISIVAGAVLVLVLFASVVGSGLPHTPTPAADAAPPGSWLEGFAQGGNYTLALLSVLFAGLAVVFSVAGWLAWKLLTQQAIEHLESRARSMLAEMARRDAREIARLASAQVHVETALTHWGVYERAVRDGQSHAAAYALDGAIQLGEFAKREFAQIEDAGMRDLHLELADRIYANLGYYLAARGTVQDVRVAAALVPRVAEIAARYRQERRPYWYDLAEAEAWISYRTQVWSPGQVRDAVDALLNDATIPQPWKDAYRPRYAVLA